MPAPTYSFTYPSLHDSTLLAGRIYHPKDSTPSLSSSPPSSPLSYLPPEQSSVANPEPQPSIAEASTTHTIQGAIIAHPYAPLGGSYDDPVVLALVDELLSRGWVVGTFNFRGAAPSKGHTSWTSKPEREDYSSFIGLFMNYLSTLSRPTSSSPSSSDIDDLSTPSWAPIDLILGGYSYGSLILTNLAPVPKILEQFENSAAGTAPAKIKERAGALGAERRRYLVARSAENRDGTLVAFGSDEAGQKGRGVRRDSVERLVKRSVDVTRKIKEGVMTRPSEKKHESSETTTGEAGERQASAAGSIAPLRVRYLLVSPLLPPVSRLLSLSLKSLIPLSHSTQAVDSSTLVSHPTLAVFGSEDMFTSASKLEVWASAMCAAAKGIFQWLEVDGASHFWREEGAEDQLRARVKQWACTDN